MARETQTARNGRGRFVRTVEQAEKDREIAEYCVGRKFRDVAQHFGLSVSTVYEARERALQAVIEPAGDAVLAAELVKLDVAEAAVIKVLRAHHVIVSDGRIVVDKDSGEKLTDSKPVLDAVRTWLGVLDKRAKYRGLYAPEEVRVLDATDAAIRQLAGELAIFDAGSEAGVPAEAEG